MVAALPHCDALVSGHSFEALGEVVEAIGAGACDAEPRRDAGRAGRRRGGAVGERDAGRRAARSAMPSGYGPSRGNTTPGWVTDE